MSHLDFIRYLSGPCEGMRIERNGMAVSLKNRKGDVLRSVFCDNENDAKSACFWMADDAYREAAT